MVHVDVWYGLAVVFVHTIAMLAIRMEGLVPFFLLFQVLLELWCWRFSRARTLRAMWALAVLNVVTIMLDWRWFGRLVREIHDRNM